MLSSRDEGSIRRVALIGARMGQRWSAGDGENPKSAQGVGDQMRPGRSRGEVEARSAVRSGPIRPGEEEATWSAPATEHHTITVVACVLVANSSTKSEVIETIFRATAAYPLLLWTGASNRRPFDTRLTGNIEVRFMRWLFWVEI